MIKDEQKPLNYRLIDQDRPQNSVLQVKKILNILEKMVNETGSINQDKSQIFDFSIKKSEELIGLYKKSSKDINIKLDTILLNSSIIHQTIQNNKENRYSKLKMSCLRN